MLTPCGLAMNPGLDGGLVMLRVIQNGLLVMSRSNMFPGLEPPSRSALNKNVHICRVVNILNEFYDLSTDK